MADPISYCFAGANELCMTQSEWAAWTQAIVTVVTFIIALARQHAVDKKAAIQKQTSDAALLQERRQHAKQQRIANENLLAEKRYSEALKAKALAIPLRLKLTSFVTSIEFLEGQGLKGTPQHLLELFGDGLDVRAMGEDVLAIRDCTEDMLAVIDAAQHLHRYLTLLSHKEALEQHQMQFITGLFTEVKPRAEAAKNTLRAIIATEVPRV